MTCIYTANDKHCNTNNNVKDGDGNGDGNKKNGSSGSEPIVEIQGSIQIKPTPHLLGKTIYLALADTDNHIGEITSSLEITKEIHHNIIKENEENVLKLTKKDQTDVI